MHIVLFHFFQILPNISPDDVNPPSSPPTIPAQYKAPSVEYSVYEAPNAKGGEEEDPSDKVGKEDATAALAVEDIVVEAQHEGTESEALGHP